MSIDFAKLVGLQIPVDSVMKGVTQIEDSSGRILWAVQSNAPIVLEVEKQSITSYASETSYSDNCVLLDIYPKKSNSEIKVTYGSLTKTLTFSGTNAMQVYFGTFNGVSDSVATPASGTLTIEGACDGFACGVYQSGSKTTNKGYCSCVAAVDEFGSITKIAPYAFRSCTNLALTELPSGITSIGSYAFCSCTNLALTSLPSGTTSIGNYAFYDCANLALTSLPRGITSVPDHAFMSCSKLKNITIHGGVTSIGNQAFAYCEKLESVIIPEGVESIGDEAFYMAFDQYFGAMVSLFEVVLPSTIKSIGYEAFNVSLSGGSGSGCYLDKLTILASTPPTVSDTGFEAQTIIVPKGCGDAYKAAEGWSAYADRITEAS